nr:DnaJ -like protein subfamily B member 5 [Ipomoea batatas]
MEHHTTTSRAEAERLLGIAEKLLRNKDYSGCKDFALLAQETEPLLESSDQILAVAEIKKQYRRFALLLHPDKNKYMFADAAFGLVADAWAVLSDPTKKSLYDNEMSLYTKVDLVPTKKSAAKRQPPTAAAARRSEDQG